MRNVIKCSQSLSSELRSTRHDGVIKSVQSRCIGLISGRRARIGYRVIKSHLHITDPVNRGPTMAHWSQLKLTAPAAAATSLFSPGRAAHARPRVLSARYRASPRFKQLREDVRACVRAYVSAYVRESERVASHFDISDFGYSAS